MKIRTDLSDLNCGFCKQPCSSLPVSSKGVYYHPLPDDKMAHSKQELPATDFNGLSLSDAFMFGKLRSMDKLHKADAVSAMYKRSLNLKHQVTRSDFLSHYSK